MQPAWSAFSPTPPDAEKNRGRAAADEARGSASFPQTDGVGISLSAQWEEKRWRGEQSWEADTRWREPEEREQEELGASVWRSLRKKGGSVTRQPGLGPPLAGVARRRRGQGEGGGAGPTC